jgi:hypothetical protein
MADRLRLPGTAVAIVIPESRGSRGAASGGFLSERDGIQRDQQISAQTFGVRGVTMGLKLRRAK